MVVAGRDGYCLGSWWTRAPYGLPPHDTAGGAGALGNTICWRLSPPYVAMKGSGSDASLSSSIDSPSSNSVSEGAWSPACQAWILHAMFDFPRGRRFQSRWSTLDRSGESGIRNVAYVMLYANSLKFSTLSNGTELIKARVRLRAVPILG